MAKYIDHESGKLVQKTATAEGGDSELGDLLVATNEDGLIADSLINAAETGEGVVVKTTEEGLINDATLGASTSSTANAIVKLDENGKLDPAMLPTGFGDDVESIVSFENLSAGDYVHVFSDEGTFSVRKADAASGFAAHGFVLASVTAPAAASVYFEGANTGVSGQTPGTVYLSASVAGAGTATAPSTSGNLVQVIGVAVASAKVNFEAGEPVELA